MTLHNLQIGKLGEKIASDYLLKKGYQIVEKNYYCRWGEIDLITKDGNKLHFIEIKTRVGTSKGKPYESINKHKIKSLTRTIQHYLLNRMIKSYKLSLDVISIILNNQGIVEKLDYFENVSF